MIFCTNITFFVYKKKWTYSASFARELYFASIWRMQHIIQSIGFSQWRRREFWWSLLEAWNILEQKLVAIKFLTHCCSKCHHVCKKTHLGFWHISAKLCVKERKDNCNKHFVSYSLCENLQEPETFPSDTQKFWETNRQEAS